MSRGWAVMIDEWVPVAHMTRQAFFANGRRRLFRAHPVGLCLCSHYNSIRPLSPLLVMFKTFGPAMLAALADATYLHVDHLAVPLAGRYHMAQPLSHNARSRNSAQRRVPVPAPDSLEGVCVAVHAWYG